MLLSCAYIHLEHKEFIKYTSDISSVNNRILLSGPSGMPPFSDPYFRGQSILGCLAFLTSTLLFAAFSIGSEIYQEILAKALAKYFGARLLLVDSLLLPGVSSIVLFNYYVLMLNCLNETKCRSLNYPTFFLFHHYACKRGTRPRFFYNWIKVLGKLIQVPFSKDSESLKGGKTEKPGVLSKRAALARTAHFRKPASSVEADILGGTSIFNCQRLPKQEASTASSKCYTFKEGMLLNATDLILCYI